MFKFLNKLRKSKKGFTLTELIVVVAILGVLAAVATPMVMNQVAAARVSADVANAKSIENAVKIEIASNPNAAYTGASDLGNIIRKSLGTLPVPQQTNFNYYVNTNGTTIAAGTTTCAASSASLGTGTWVQPQ